MIPIFSIKRTNAVIYSLLGSMLIIAVFFCGNKIAFRMTTTPVDVPFFISEGNKFWQTGYLYARADTPESMAWIYAPSGCCNYKNPPVSQLLLIQHTIKGLEPFYRIIPVLNWKVLDPEKFTGMRIRMLILYGLSAAIIMRMILGRNKQLLIPTNRLIFIISSAIIFCLSDPIFFLLDTLSTEVIFFFLVTISVAFMGEKNTLSGFLMGVTAAMKIYPVILLFYFVAKKSKSGIVGFLAGMLLSTLVGLAVFGFRENIYYWTNVFPVLLKELSSTADYNLSLSRQLMRITDAHYATIFSIVKFSVLGFSFWLVARSKENDTIRDVSIMLIAMLIFLKNYWSPYQIYLLIPLTWLIEKSLIDKSTLKSCILVVCSFLLFLDFDWVDLSKEIIELQSHNPTDLLNHTSAMSNAEAFIKSILFSWPQFPSIMYWIFQVKTLLPFILLWPLAQDSLARPLSSCKETLK
jgi:hypothetical protein